MVEPSALDPDFHRDDGWGVERGVALVVPAFHPRRRVIQAFESGARQQCPSFDPERHFAVLRLPDMHQVAPRLPSYAVKPLRLQSALDGNDPSSIRLEMSIINITA